MPVAPRSPALRRRHPRALRTNDDDGGTRPGATQGDRRRRGVREGPGPGEGPRPSPERRPLRTPDPLPRLRKRREDQQSRRAGESRVPPTTEGVLPLPLVAEHPRTRTRLAAPRSHSAEARRHAAPTTTSRGAREGGAHHPLSPTVGSGANSRVARSVSYDPGTRWRNGKRTSRRGRSREARARRDRSDRRVSPKVYDLTV